MFYEEMVIEGVLHCRGTPDGEWRPVSPQTLTSKLAEAKQVTAQQVADWLRANTTVPENRIAQWTKVALSA